MPYDNLPESQWDEMDRCVESVMSKDGKDKEAAIAICYASITGKSASIADNPPVLSFAKGENLTKKIDDVIRSWGEQYQTSSSIPNPVPSYWVCEVETDAIIVEGQGKYYRVPYTVSDEKIVFSPSNEWKEVEKKTEWKFKNALKAISQTDDELRVGNYIVLFGGRDLTGVVQGKNADGSAGEYFTPKTDLESDYTKSGVLHVDFEHALDPDNIGAGRDTVLGFVDWKTAKTDDRGVFVERVLNRRQKYVQWLSELINAGMIGNSTEAIGEQVQKSANGEIVRWPLRRDTLTVNPMEPRMLAGNALQAAKALSEILPALKSVIPADNQPETPQAADSAVTMAGAVSQEVYSKGATLMENTITPEMLQQIADQAANKAVEAFKAAAPAPDTAGHLTVVKDETEQPFKSLGEFLLAVKDAALKPYQIDQRLKSLKASGANEANPSEGGFLLQNQYAPGLIERVYQTGAISSLISPDEVGPNSNSMTYKRVVETSRADGSRWGGLRAYWTSEAADFTASKPAWGEMLLKLNKLTALFYATDEMLEDSTALASYVNRVVPQELAFKLDAAILSGTGAGQPLGVLNGAGLVSVAAETGQAVDTILYENVIKMWARRFVGFRDYVWLVSQDSQPQLDTLAFAVGTGVLPPNFISYNNEGVMQIKGRPVIETEQSPKLGDVGDLLLFSPSAYQMIRKGGVNAASSMHVLFTTDEMAYRWVLRCDGQPSFNAALTPYNGSGATVSPYVAIAAR